MGIWGLVDTVLCIVVQSKEPHHKKALMSGCPLLLELFMAWPVRKGKEVGDLHDLQGVQSTNVAGVNCTCTLSY